MAKAPDAFRVQSGHLNAANLPFLKKSAAYMQQKTGYPENLLQTGADRQLRYLKKDAFAAGTTDFRKSAAYMQQKNVNLTILLH